MAFPDLLDRPVLRVLRAPQDRWARPGPREIRAQSGWPSEGARLKIIKLKQDWAVGARIGSSIRASVLVRGLIMTDGEGAPVRGRSGERIASGLV